MAKPKKVPPTFIATGAENRCVVTVRMLAEEEEEGWMVEVEIHSVGILPAPRCAPKHHSGF